MQFNTARIITANTYNFQYISGFNENSRTVQNDTVNYLAENRTGCLKRKGRNQSRRRRVDMTKGLNHRPKKCLEAEPEIFALNQDY